jgi:hypothetical protein
MKLSNRIPLNSVSCTDSNNWICFELSGTILWRNSQSLSQTELVIMSAIPSKETKSINRYQISCVLTLAITALIIILAGYSLLHENFKKSNLRVLKNRNVEKTGSSSDVRAAPSEDAEITGITEMPSPVGITSDLPPVTPLPYPSYEMAWYEAEKYLYDQVDLADDKFVTWSLRRLMFKLGDPRMNPQAIFIDEATQEWSKDFDDRMNAQQRRDMYRAREAVKALDVKYEEPVLDLQVSVSDAEILESLSEKLRAEVEDPTAKCGEKWNTLVKAYAKWHEVGLKLLLARSPRAPKVWVYRCRFLMDCGGLADRTLGVTTSFVMSLRYNRLLLIDWPESSYIWRSSYFNWKWTTEISNALQELGRTEHFLSLHNCGDFVNGPCLWKLHDPGRAFPEDFIVTNVNRGALNRGKDGSIKPHIDWLMQYLDEELAPGCLYRTIFTPSLQLIHGVQEKAEEILNFRGMYVGMHIRTGDKHMLNDTTEPEKYLWWYPQCYDRHSEFQVKMGVDAPKLFFISDSQAVKMAVVKKYGSENVIIMDQKASHFNPRDFKVWGERTALTFEKTVSASVSAFSEWWLFSLCNYHFIDVDSGFARTAAVYSVRGTQSINPFCQGTNVQALGEKMAGV